MTKTMLDFYEVAQDTSSTDFAADTSPSVMKREAKTMLRRIDRHISDVDVTFLTVWNDPKGRHEVEDFWAKTASETARDKVAQGFPVTVWCLLDDTTMPVADRKPTAFVVADSVKETALHASLERESKTHTEECNEGTKICGPDCDAVALSALFESDDPYISAAKAVIEDDDKGFVPAMFRF